MGSFNYIERRDQLSHQVSADCGPRPTGIDIDKPIKRMVMKLGVYRERRLPHNHLILLGQPREGFRVDPVKLQGLHNASLDANRGIVEQVTRSVRIV
jgi:hypothetical protein